VLDRRHLATWSLGLDDRDFVAALAALGVLAALDPRRARADPLLADAAAAVDAARTDGQASAALVELLRVPMRGRAGASIVLEWRTPSAPDAPGRPPAGLREWPGAAHLAAAWQTVASSAPPLRIDVRDEASHTRALEFAELLSHDGAQLAGIHAAADWAHEPTGWRWPITIATRRGEALGARLAQVLPRDDSVARLERDTAPGASVELLALVAPSPRALADALSNGALPRCALAVVADASIDPSYSASLLQALAVRLRAGGVVVAPGRSVERIADDLCTLVGCMLRGVPLDVALKEALGSGYVAWLTSHLVAASRHPGAARAGPRVGARRPLESAPPPPPAPSAAPPPIGANVPPPMSTGATGDRTARREDRSRSAIPEATAATARRSDERPARHLQQRSMRGPADAREVIRDGYVRDEPVLLFVRIGAPGDATWDSLPTPFPEHELPPDRDAHRLQVVVHEPTHIPAPLLGELVLPRTGPSSEAEFRFTPRASGPFDARIGVLHRGRVLQTARLRTRVLEKRGEAADGIALLEETRVRHDWSDLDRRRRFDLAMVLNHAADGTPRLTAVAERRAWATSLDGIRDPLLQLNATLSEAAHSVADHVDGLDRGENPRLLVRLARIGADLYSALCLDQFVELTHGDFDPRADTLTHVQVVSARADAVVPIEFFYDHPPPAADATRVCPGHREALRTGRCPADCAGRADPLAHVCPMGFWGLRKVVERHVYSPRLGRPDNAELVIQAEPAAGRDRLDLGHCAVLGFSRQVPRAASGPVLELLSPRFSGATLEAVDWSAWKDAVGRHKPGLLVAFPHNEGKQQDIRLEIGGDLLSTLRLPRDYVRPEGAAPPLVFLLGCDVAGTAEPFSNHIRYFRQAGAAAVISTTATVFGEHAVTVGTKILARLLRAGGDDADQLGELILDARREALLDSLPMALCIVAFGDADWRL